MTQIQIFQFNSFQVNTFVIWDDSKECVIIDPGCFSKDECELLTGFIAKNGLKPVRLKKFSDMEIFETQKVIPENF